MDSEYIHIYTYKARLTNAQRYKFAKKKKGINGVQLRKISNALTGVLKTQIRKQGHVDTGKMVNGTKVIATIGARGELVAKVFSKADYWKYVNGNFDILENAMKTRKWKEIEEQFNIYNQGHPKRR
tara:strand:- start:373 stop:750 length:378 start_codon:yes stop_codon:yes gene_type:complete